MAQRVESEFTLDTAAELAAEERMTTIRGRSPWYLAWRRLRRNYFAFAALGLFILIVKRLIGGRGPAAADRRDVPQPASAV